MRNIAIFILILIALSACQKKSEATPPAEVRNAVSEEVFEEQESSWGYGSFMSVTDNVCEFDINGEEASIDRFYLGCSDEQAAELLDMPDYWLELEYVPSAGGLPMLLDYYIYESDTVEAEYWGWYWVDGSEVNYCAFSDEEGYKLFIHCDDGQQEEFEDNKELYIHIRYWDYGGDREIIDYNYVSYADTYRLTAAFKSYDGIYCNFNALDEEYTLWSMLCSDEAAAFFYQYPHGIFELNWYYAENNEYVLDSYEYTDELPSREEVMVGVDEDYGLCEFQVSGRSDNAKLYCDTDAYYPEGAFTIWYIQNIIDNYSYLVAWDAQEYLYISGDSELYSVIGVFTGYHDMEEICDFRLYNEEFSMVQLFCNSEKAADLMEHQYDSLCELSYSPDDQHLYNYNCFTEVPSITGRFMGGRVGVCVIQDEDGNDRRFYCDTELGYPDILTVWYIPGSVTAYMLSYEPVKSE